MAIIANFTVNLMETNLFIRVFSVFKLILNGSKKKDPWIPKDTPERETQYLMKN